ncbi:uncharacterized protein EDB91DRAFT_1256570 [Suillus paluster]|uniref:uncharacterized protein n=1 Tax=Suillus paluster TaxID=48578 RepID=UPI001B865447|nr:uncharacterized protein EDB91DRAFT_1256570 [Suillus paluster]KAG1721315.1 hypothetical protein EDB91DRAFT_1256570 [Suillus paluster]
MPPKRKSTAGGQLAGISRAGPGTVEIGSMIPQPSATIRQSSNAPASHAINTGNYCHFCCDHVEAPCSHECIECGGIMCQQFVPHSSGCIYFGTVDASKPFLCPICCRTGDGKDAVLPYAVLGYWIRQKVKMTWPMVVVNLSLESMKDDYLGLTVRCDIDNHYRDHKDNLSIESLHMRRNAHGHESRKLVPSIEFVQRNTKAGFPPNTFVIIDTHSDEYSGMLQHTGGHSGGTNTTITEITAAYLGAELLQSMGDASRAARHHKTEITTKSGKKPWCDLSAKTRGGWRGLIMMSCGPAIRVHHHFKSVVQLVNDDQFDFVLGFGGSGTLPSLVAPIVRSLVVETGVFGRTDIWTSFCDLIAANQGVLDYTAAVLVYSTVFEGNRRVECRQVAKNMPGLRAFGAELGSCATPGCNPSSSDMRVFNRTVNGKPKVSVRCLKCSWRSAWARTDQDNKHFKRVHPIIAPQVFWHHFPPSAELQNFFVTITDDEASQAKGKGENKGGKGKGRMKRKLDTASVVMNDTEMMDKEDSDDGANMDVN